MRLTRRSMVAFMVLPSERENQRPGEGEEECGQECQRQRVARMHLLVGNRRSRRSSEEDAKNEIANEGLSFDAPNGGTEERVTSLLARIGVLQGEKPQGGTSEQKCDKTEREAQPPHECGFEQKREDEGHVK